MLTLGKTIKSLQAGKANWERLVAGAAAGAGQPGTPGEASSRLEEIRSFGSNPGALRMFSYVPPGLKRPPSGLVVVLHGCTQTAAGYDHGAGWSTLADRFGFALLLPEQQPANNPKRCFNWFLPADTRREAGEAASIREMVERMLVDHRIDRTRVFVTGLSAGGAMTSAMLATYPEVFAAGSIIAGLPYGAAGNVQEALESMFQGRSRPAREWGDLVRGASPHKGPWPRVSVWHGGADATVKPSNAVEIVKQWTDVQGLSSAPTREERRDGFPRQVWCGPSGEELIEFYAIPGMAHGTPLAVGTGESQAGAAGPFLLEVGISSSYQIAKFWGLTDAAPRAAASLGAEAPPTRKPTTIAPPPRPAAPAGAAPAGGSDRQEERRTPLRGINVGEVITKALKAAGLVK